MTSPNQTPIAIIGISSIFPGSPKVADFWRHICAGTDLLTDTPSSHWLKEDYCNPDYRYTVPHARGGYVPEMDFDPVAFRIPPNQLESTDTVQLLALLATKELVDGLNCLHNGKVSPEDVSCILGVAGSPELLGQMSAKIQRGNWLYALRGAGIAESVAQKICDRIEDTYSEWTENTFPGLLTNVVSGRITNHFDFGGTNCTLDAACASSLAAITMAIQELQLGNCRLVISGGADALNDPGMYMCFTRTYALSPSGDCRPFDKNGDGTVLGEGLGFVALKRLEDAEADGDSIYAVIKGYGSSSDGRSKSVYAPRSSGQALAIRRAYQKAGYDLDTVELIEAHGTATSAGDLAEYEGLKQAFQESGRQDTQWCALGSVKSQIGHTKSTAGAASLIKAALALHHKILPTTIKVTEPNPKLDFTNGPLYLNTETRPWINNGKHPRRAGLSSLGFGGTNFHVTLEEYTGPSATPPYLPQDATSLLLFSSDSTSNLKLAVVDIREQLEKCSLIAVAKYSQQNFRADADQRLAIVASDKNKAVDLINRAEQRLSDDDPAWNIPGSIYFSSRKREGKLAFLFPGQGSQYLNMGSELLNAFPQAHRAWEEANAFLEESLQATVFPVPVFTKEDKDQQVLQLRQTDLAQPALGATSLAFLTLLKTLGLKPDLVAGHSYGELVALHVAGVISSPQELMQVSARRGAFMVKQAANAEVTGTMCVVFASSETMDILLSEMENPLVVIANDNSPKQVVIAGPVADIIEAEQLLDARDIKYRRLPVSAAFHTPQVAGAEKDFAAYLDTITWHQAQIPVYSNKTSEVYPEDTAEQKALLANQLASPVRFREMIKTLVEDGVTTLVEVGPGNALTGLARDCLNGNHVHTIAMDNKKQSSHNTFWNLLGQLSVIGYELNFANLWTPFAVEDLTQVHPKLSAAAVKISGTNYGRPYPPEGGSEALPPPVHESQSDSLSSSDRSLTEPDGAIKDCPLGSGDEPHRPLQSRYEKSLIMSNTISDQNNSGDPMAVESDHIPSVQEVTSENSAPLIPTANASPSTLLAFQQTVNMAQMQFQQTMTQCHLEFLRTSSMALQSLNGSSPATSQAFDPATPTHHNGSPPASFVPQSSTPSNSPAPVRDEVVPPETTPAFQPAVVSPEMQTVLSNGHTNGRTPTPSATASAPVAKDEDFPTVLIQVTADKTGYPGDMLDLEADLEADMGIDSIKRVEILSEMQQRFPQLAAIEAEKLTMLQSLAEILDLYNQQSGSQEVAAEAPFFQTS